MNKFLEAGVIVTTHGVRGDMRMELWCDGADFLSDFKTVYIDEKPVKLLSVKPHKQNVIIRLEGVEDMTAAEALKGKKVFIDRSGVTLPEGRHFIADLIGLTVVDTRDNSVKGKLTDVISYPTFNIYTVKGEKTYSIPAVKQFIDRVDLENGTIYINFIKGLENDEN